MAQSPFRVDQVDIEPGSSGTRRISRATDGSLQFQDPTITAAVLSALVGMRNITGLYIVGRDGDGSPYTTIQDAIDAIPDTSSVTTPSVVLVGPGEYEENLTINKDGVSLIGLGKPRVTAAAGSTISIEDTALSTPQNVLLQNLVIENTGAAGVCVALWGAGTYASGTVTVVTAPLAAGDEVEIGGITLTGVVGDRTSGDDNFSVDPATPATMAVEIAAAINDSANSLAATVAASAAGAVVTITAVAPGVGGNAITLVVTTTPAGGLTVSGGALTGGGSADSPVAFGSVDVIDCDLVASGVGGLQIDADTVNHIRVQGGTWRGSSSNSLARVVQCAAFRLTGVEWANDFEFAYDSGNDQPEDTTSEYRITHCGRIRNILSSQVGVGSLLVAHCPEVGDLVAGGDQTLLVSHSRTGTVSLDDTLAATFAESSRGVASVAGGTPTLAESAFTGSVAFVASASEAVGLQIPGPDGTYAVLVDSPDAAGIPQATVKAASGFTLTTAAPITGTVFYTVLRQL